MPTFHGLRAAIPTSLISLNGKSLVLQTTLMQAGFLFPHYDWDVEIPTNPLEQFNIKGQRCRVRIWIVPWSRLCRPAWITSGVFISVYLYYVAAVSDCEDFA